MRVELLVNDSGSRIPIQHGLPGAVEVQVENTSVRGFDAPRSRPPGRRTHAVEWIWLSVWNRVPYYAGNQRTVAVEQPIVATNPSELYLKTKALVQTRRRRAMMKRRNGSSRSKICSKDGTSTDRSSFCA